MAERDAKSVKLQATPIVFERQGEAYQVGTVDMRLRKGKQKTPLARTVVTKTEETKPGLVLHPGMPLTPKARRKQRLRKIGKGVLIASCVIPPWGFTVLVGWLIMRSRPKGKAKRLLRKAFQVASTNPNAALPLLEEAHKVDPSNNDILAVAGYVAHNAEDYTMAWRFLNELSRHTDLTPSEQLLFGHALYETENYDRAIEVLQQIPNDFADYTRVAVLLGGCFRAKGDPEAALEILDKGPLNLLARNDDLKELQYQMGLLYEAKGDFEAANDCFRRVYLADVSYRDVRERIAPADRKALPAPAELAAESVNETEPEAVVLLRRLADLKDEGILTEDEYERKKAALLAQI